MKTLLWVSSLTVAQICLLTSMARAGTIIYEPFDYTPGNPIAGSVDSYSPGSPTWNAAGTSTTPIHNVASGNLSGPAGFPASTGNSANLMGNDFTEYERLNLPSQI